MSKREEVLVALSAGPVRRYTLLNGREGIFRLAYRKLLAEGQIVESGTGGVGNPVYVGLQGSSFPVPRYTGGVRDADIAMLVRSGMTDDVARETLQTAIDSPGDNGAALMVVLMDAKTRIERNGDDWEAAIPLPHAKRGAGRPRKGEPFFNPLMPLPPEFDGKYRL
jgi:hypothetical protein